MKAINTQNWSAVLIAGAIVLLAFILLIKPVQQVVGSTARGSEYQATTTSPNRFPAEYVLQDTYGTLGSVNVTGTAGGSEIYLYDATTSNIALRGNTATSSLLVAHFPLGMATGTYPFDLILRNGLYIRIIGAIPTTTITFRQ